MGEEANARAGGSDGAGGLRSEATEAGAKAAVAAAVDGEGVPRDAAAGVGHLRAPKVAAVASEALGRSFVAFFQISKKKKYLFLGGCKRCAMCTHGLRQKERERALEQFPKRYLDSIWNDIMFRFASSSKLKSQTTPPKPKALLK